MTTAVPLRFEHAESTPAQSSPLRNLPIGKKGLIVVSAPMLLVVGLLAFLYSIGRSLDVATQWALHSQAVLARLDALASGMIELHGDNLQLALLGRGEHGFRGEMPRVRLASTLRELQQMITDDPAQAEVFRAFVPEAERLLDELARTSDTLRRGEITAGARRAAEDNVRLQRAIARTDQLTALERQRSLERLARANRLGRSQRWALLAGGFLTITLACLLGGSTMAGIVRRLLVIRQNVDRIAADAELLSPMPGDDEIGRIDRAVHELVRSLRAQRSENDMFLYSVSHDLRSPLVNLQGFGRELTLATERLRELLLDPDVPQQVRDDVERVLEDDFKVAQHYIDVSVQRQSRTIDSLLSLSRAGRVVYSWQAVDLGPRLREIVTALRGREELCGVEFTVGEIAPVHGDPVALERVFDNLIGNAVKYLADDRPGRIEIGTQRRSGDVVVLFVRDNGIGIAPEHLERVFLPFTRYAKGPGEGIGLSLVRRVVDRHHGRVWIESTPNVGTTVYVALRAAGVASPPG